MSPGLRPPPFTTSIPHPFSLLAWDFLAGDGTKLNNDAPPPPRTANSPAPKNFNQLPFFSFPFC